MNEDGYSYLRKSQGLYAPKTPRAALKAIEIGLLPDEAFIYRANSVHPLFEEPIDISAIERTLSNKNNDLSTNTLLVGILEKMLSDRDSEIALFAAESINAIENIYNERIEGFKQEYAKTDSPDNLRKIARQFYEVGLINESRRAIRNFYLLEAYTYIKRYEERTGLDSDDLKFVVGLMIKLKSLTLARKVIVHALKQFPEDIEMLVLAAEVEFHRKNYSQVHYLFERLKPVWTELPEKLKAAFEHWIAEA